MISLDDELATEYLAECREQMATVDADLRAIKKGAAAVDLEPVRRVFHAVHSVKTGAGFFDLVKIGELAAKTEDVLAVVRSGEMFPTPHRLRVLLSAAERLNQLIANPAASNEAEIAGTLTALANLLDEDHAAVSLKGRRSNDSKPLQLLLVEDDSANRLLLQTFLSRYGECRSVVNGIEAVESVRAALEHKQEYALICMDITMPEMNGQEAVRQIRALEEAAHVHPERAAHIVMTTATADIREVFRCFREGCDGYILKPIDLPELLNLMRSWQLVP
jgi:two-component system chemotaxis response regulator CheY